MINANDGSGNGKTVIVPAPASPSNPPPPPAGNAQGTAKQPQAAKPDDKNKPDEKKPESLDDAIKRMRLQHKTDLQIFEQIKRWNPSWSNEKIDNLLRPRSAGPPEPQHAKPMQSPADQEWLNKHRHDKEASVSHWLEREVRETAKAVVKAIRHDERKYGKELGREAAKVEKAVVRAVGHDKGLQLDLRYGKEVANWGGNLGKNALHVTLDAAATIPYGAYYASYKVLGATKSRNTRVNVVLDIFTPRGLVVEIEAIGLGGDAAIDLIKGHTVNHESIRDEGQQGYINPLHGFLPRWLRGPRTRLPGIRQSGGVDWYW